MNYILSYKDELYRKFLHLSSIWIPLTYYFLEKRNMIYIMFTVSFLALIYEILKKYIPIVNFIYKKIFYKILRISERNNQISGGCYLLLGCFITILLFSKFIAIISITILIIADSFAAIIGKKYGKIIITDNKTLEGSLAFMISGLITLYVIGLYSSQKFKYYFICFFAMVITSLVELYSKKLKIDDNFSIPFTVAIIISILL